MVRRAAAAGPEGQSSPHNSFQRTPSCHDFSTPGAGVRLTPRTLNRQAIPPNPTPMPKAAGLVVLLLSLLPMQLAGQGATPADPLVGCYRIELGEWMPNDHPEREHPVPPPRTFRILADVGTERLERGRALVRPLLRARDGGGAYWERVGPDSVRIVWSTAFWGADLQMRIAGESLRGVATSWTDVMYVNHDGTPFPGLRAEAVARRVRCPRELRD
jgi:hypothetical protein